MSIQRSIFKGASWLALFKLVSQSFSWVITILIARILMPSDYGLMEMATIITNYAFFFSDMGLGSAIVQRNHISKSELSSLFWLNFSFAFLLTLICFAGSYVMASIFHEPRIVPLIQALSLVFTISSFQIIPMALLSRNLDFKKIGEIEVTITIISCIGMLIIARMGGGVWTLVGGAIIRSLARLVIVFYRTKWVPQLHLNFNEAKNYLKFGFTVFLGRSFYYAFEKTDKFFAGRTWSAQMLGYYSFALTLAQLPTEKITVLINTVSFPAFSKLQNNMQEFRKFYLQIVYITATLVIPIFVGGFFLGDEIIKLLLNDKWYPIIDIFKYLCLSQIVTSLNAINSFVHYSLGRPKMSLYFHASCALLMGISFYYAVQYGLFAILIPWFTTYLIICTSWTIITLNTIGISIAAYCKKLLNPVTAVFIMSLGIISFDYFTAFYDLHGLNMLSRVSIKIGLGIFIYTGYFWVFDRQLFYKIRELSKPQAT
jgi:O-antigen/teichoic acid export membrane protein